MLVELERAQVGWVYYYLARFQLNLWEKNVCMLIAEYDCHDISIMHIVAMSMSSQKYFWRKDKFSGGQWGTYHFGHWGRWRPRFSWHHKFWTPKQSGLILKSFSPLNHTFLILKAYPDVFTRVSSFVPWINTTVLNNGGLAGCNFSIIAPPMQGKPDQERWPLALILNTLLS